MKHIVTACTPVISDQVQHLPLHPLSLPSRQQQLELLYIHTICARIRLSSGLVCSCDVISLTVKMSASQSKESSPDCGSNQQTASSPASSRSSCSTGTSVLTGETCGGQRDNVQMKRNLSLWNGVTIIVGIIVGSGIFVSPKGVMQEIHSVGASLIVWIASGILSTIGAICYAELGTAIPESGGDYAYIKRSFGPLPAFLFLYVALFIIMPAGNAVAALTFAHYIVQPITGCPEKEIKFIIALVAAVAVCEYISGIHVCLSASPFCLISLANH